MVLIEFLSVFYVVDFLGLAILIVVFNLTTCTFLGIKTTAYGAVGCLGVHRGTRGFVPDPCCLKLLLCRLLECLRSVSLQLWLSSC